MVFDFVEKRFLSIGDGIRKNVILFREDMSSSLHIDNKKEKRYFNSWKKFYRKIRTYTDCRKLVFNQL